MKPLRRSLLHALLALCLLAAQWAAGQHAVEHAKTAASGAAAASAPSGSSSGHTPGVQHCDLCLAFGALDAAPATPPPALTDQTPGHLAAIAVRVVARCAEFTAYASRAPPRVV
jgi:hypothetical protein